MGEGPELFTLGVNYWPRRKAMYWWSDFDAGEVREEFALIQELGLRMVRIFLLWDDFQPTPDQVPPARLANLRTVCDIAAEMGLTLNVTFFTGHMSGPNWAPRWLLHGPPAPGARQLVSGGRIVQSGYRNPYTDPQALRAERLLLRTVVGELRDHPAIGLWNLGNEPDLLATPPDAATGARWVRDMVALIRERDPAHPVTCGLHIDSLQRDNGLRVDQVFHETDLAVMHAYPMYAPWARAPLDPDFVPFTCAVTRALSGRPVLMEEFGGCTVGPGEPAAVWRWEGAGRPREQFMASEDDLAAYLARVLPKLLEVGAVGALTWCFADYAPALWDKPPCADFRHERFFGLVRPDGSLKPHARVLQDFARTAPRVLAAPARAVTLPGSADDYYRAPLDTLIALYQTF
jgi:endo-1,4-beta-mannosidase